MMTSSPRLRSSPKIIVSFDSDALRVIAISSASHPKSRASSRRTLSIRGSSTPHMCSTGSSFENRRSRIICSSTWLGAGLQPPLFRFTIVRSRSNARWISAQYASSSVICCARARRRNASARRTGSLTIGSAALAPFTEPRNARRSGMGEPRFGTEGRWCWWWLVASDEQRSPRATRHAPLSPNPHHLHELLIHPLRVRVARADRRRRAVLEMVAQQLASHAPQRFLHRRDLHEDVGAVPFLLDHLLQPSHLSLDAPEPLLIPLLDGGVYRHGLAIIAGATAATG